jgi:hypothetical protein
MAREGATDRLQGLRQLSPRTPGDVSRCDIEMLARYLDMLPERVVKECTIVDPEDPETLGAGLRS